MSRDQIVKFWGDLLQPVPAELLNTVVLPEETRRFMAEVGLPDDDRLDTYLSLGIKFYPPNVRPVTYQNEVYLDFGEINLDWGPRSIFCIQAASGKIFNLAPEIQESNSLMLVNTTLQKFLLFLSICLQHKPRLLELSKKWDDLIQHKVSPAEARKTHANTRKQYIQALEALQAEFLTVDPAALCGMEGCYWSEMLFDWSI